MKISKNLYVSENIKNEKQILDLLCNGIDIYGIYLICILKDSQSIFEIFESRQFFKTFNKDKEWILIGISNSKQEALLLVERIFKENITEDIFDFKKIF